MKINQIIRDLILPSIPDIPREPRRFAMVAVRGASKSTLLVVMRNDDCRGITLTPADDQTSSWIAQEMAQLKAHKPVSPTSLDHQQVVSFVASLRTENATEHDEVIEYPISIHDVAGALTEIDNVSKRADDSLFHAKRLEYANTLRQADVIMIVVDRVEDSEDSRQQVLSYQNLLGIIKSANFDRDIFPPIVILISKWDRLSPSDELNDPELEQQHLTSFLQQPENQDVVRLVESARGIAKHVRVLPIATIRGACNSDGQFEVQRIAPFNLLESIKWALPITDELIVQRMEESWTRGGFDRREWPEANDASEPQSAVEAEDALRSQGLAGLVARFDLANQAHALLGAKHPTAVKRLAPVLHRVHRVLTRKRRIWASINACAVLASVATLFAYEEIDARSRFVRAVRNPSTASYLNVVKARDWYQWRGMLNPFSYLSGFASRAETQTRDAQDMLAKQILAEYESRYPKESRPDKEGEIRNQWIHGVQEQLSAPWLLADHWTDNREASLRWESLQKVDSTVAYIERLVHSGNGKSMRDAIPALEQAIQTFAASEGVADLKQSREDLLSAIALLEFHEEFQQLASLPELQIQEIVSKKRKFKVLRDTTPVACREAVEKELDRLCRVEVVMQKSMLASLLNDERFADAKTFVESFGNETWDAEELQRLRMECDRSWDAALWRRVTHARDRVRESSTESRLTELNAAIEDYLNMQGIEDKRMVFATKVWSEYWQKMHEPMDLSLVVKSLYLPNDSELLAGWFDDTYQYPKVTVSIESVSKTNPQSSNYVKKGQNHQVNFNLGPIQVPHVLGQRCTVELSCYGQSTSTSITKSLPLVELLHDVQIREKSKSPHTLSFQCKELQIPVILDYQLPMDTSTNVSSLVLP